jgi:hypothetical protein
MPDHEVDDQEPEEPILRYLYLALTYAVAIVIDVTEVKLQVRIECVFVLFNPLTFYYIEKVLSLRLIDQKPKTFSPKYSPSSSS